MKRKQSRSEVRSLRKFLRDRRNLSNAASCRQGKDLSKLLFETLHPLSYSKLVKWILIKEHFASPDTWFKAMEVCKSALIESHYDQLRVLYKAIPEEGEFKEKFRTKIRKELIIGPESNDILTESRFAAQERFLKDTINR